MVKLWLFHCCKDWKLGFAFEIHSPTYLYKDLFVLHVSWNCETFMAALLPSSQRCEEVASLQSQVSQEKELRAVMEGCLMEEKMAWRRVNAELVENHRLAQDMSATLAEFKACRSELLSRLTNEEKSISGVQGGRADVRGEVWRLLHVTFHCYQN